jgi:hypothetical protein
MVLSRLELETYSYQKYTLPIKLKNRMGGYLKINRPECSPTTQKVEVSLLLYKGLFFFYKPSLKLKQMNIKQRTKARRQS